jgi:hypothetical protein
VLILARLKLAPGNQRTGENILYYFFCKYVYHKEFEILHSPLQFQWEKNQAIEIQKSGKDLPKFLPVRCMARL